MLDAGRVCHIGFVDGGRPWVIPAVYGRDGNSLFLHGAALGRLMTTLAGGVEVCVTVTIVDGLVLARSAFAHSMNYRSVVVAGIAHPLRDTDARLHALRCVVEHVLPGRWSEVRTPTQKELDVTAVLALPLDNLSCKARTGPPLDPARDRLLPVWAGELALREVLSPPLPDAGLADSVALPASVLRALEGMGR